MDKNEEHVRSVWEDVRVRTSEPFEGYAKGLTVIEGPGWGFANLDRQAALTAASEFTREHKEKVRQLMRQVSLMKEGLTDWAIEILLSKVGGEMSADLMNADYVRDECTGYFVLALLEAELTRLTAGMKPEAV